MRNLLLGAVQPAAGEIYWLKCRLRTFRDHTRFFSRVCTMHSVTTCRFYIVECQSYHLSSLCHNPLQPSYHERNDFNGLEEKNKSHVSKHFRQSLLGISAYRILARCGKQNLNHFPNLQKKSKCDTNLPIK